MLSQGCDSTIVASHYCAPSGLGRFDSTGTQGVALGYPMAPFQGSVQEKMPSPNGAKELSPGQRLGNAVQPNFQSPEGASEGLILGGLRSVCGTWAGLYHINEATPLSQHRFDRRGLAAYDSCISRRRGGFAPAHQAE